VDRDLLANLDCQDHQDFLDKRDLVDQLDRLDLQAIGALLEPLVHRGNQVPRVNQVQLDQGESKGLPVLLGPRAP